MATDEFLQEDLDDEKTVEFIKNYLPQDLKEKFTDDELYYFLDLIVDYYASSGCLDVEPDSDGYIEIDQDAIVDYIVKEAKKGCRIFRVLDGPPGKRYMVQILPHILSESGPAGYVILIQTIDGLRSEHS